MLSGGIAGYLCAVGLKARMPGLEVKLIRLRDSEPGYNQSSSLSLTRFLHGFLPLELRKFIEMARPVWTLGHKMIWGPRDHYYHPYTTQLDLRSTALPRNNAFYVGDDVDEAGALTAMMAQDKVFYRMKDGQPAWAWDVGYQLDNALLIQCLTTLGSAIGIEVVDDSLVEAKVDATGITGLVMASGATETGDLYIDASEAKSLLLGGALKEPFVSFKSSLPCDRIVLGGWARGNQPMHGYSTCETMDAGWCWQLELQDRIERGYVFSSAHLSDEQAAAELRSKNPNIAETRALSFKSGRYEPRVRKERRCRWGRGGIRRAAAQHVPGRGGGALPVAGRDSCRGRPHRRASAHEAVQPPSHPRVGQRSAFSGAALQTQYTARYPVLAGGTPRRRAERR